MLFVFPMTASRVLVVLKTESAWSRGVLGGFMAVAHERGWTVLYYNSPSDLRLLTKALQPIAAIVATEFDAPELVELGSARLVSVTVDRTAENIPSVCLDEAAIGKMAYEHLRGTGIRDVAAFRYDESHFAVARECAFVEAARAGGTRVAPGWGLGEQRSDRRENPAAMVAWLRALPNPCGIFTCTDGWARAVSRYTLLAGLRIPEDIALIGADNDVLECELMSPPLSTVLIPWREVGRSVATLVQHGLSGKPDGVERIVIAPLTVIARRSTELLAVDDALVARAVEWIRANSAKRITVPTVARAAASGRHRLERAFRRTLGRTIQAEIRRARVESAKRLLEASRSSLAEIAQTTGFKTASLLTAAFQRELGITPGSYRRRVQPEMARAGED
jgi:LacI family transcriptional regulator, galactose operon repressor